MERKVEELEGSRGGKPEGADMKREIRGEEIVESRLLEIKKKDRDEGKEREKNYYNKRVEVKYGTRREAVEEVLKVIIVKVDIEEIRKLGGEKEKRNVIVKLKSKEQKKGIMKTKRKLKGRKKRIMEDLTWRKKDKMEARGDS